MTIDQNNGLLIDALWADWLVRDEQDGFYHKDGISPNALQASADSCIGSERINIVDIYLSTAYRRTPVDKMRKNSRLCICV